MAKKTVDRAHVDLVRAGVSAYHAHRWIKELQRSLGKTSPDWQAYRNALAYLTLTEKHLIDWMSHMDEAAEDGYSAAQRRRLGPHPVPGPAKASPGTAAKAGKRSARSKRKPERGPRGVRSGKRAVASERGGASAAGGGAEPRTATA